MNMAEGPRPDPAPVGGLTKQQTDSHYAHAFDGSVARVQLALLDPLGQVSRTSKTLSQFLTGGNLCLADVPSGAGAASLALLCTIAHLRECEELPRVPLRVHILFGEISDPARILAEELTAATIASLASQAIFVTFDSFSWNVLCEMSNANLVEKIIVAKSTHPMTLLMISNFNGFLEKENKKKQAYPQISELFKYCSGRMNAAVWVEPNMNSAKLGLFPWLFSKKPNLGAFVKLILPKNEHESCNYRFALPVNPKTSAAVRLCVVPLDLVKKV